MNHPFEKYQTIIQQTLQEHTLKEKKPENLYIPLDYALSTKGKYLRPILTLAAFELFSTETDFEQVRKSALAIEWLHNFTLIHDDIMDESPLRRGKPTIYKKWNRNTAILSGDVLLIKAYQLFEDLPPEPYKKVLSLFTDTAIKICEGQQYDMDFESRNDIRLPEYMNMIRLKTAVLLGASLKIGALVGGASNNDAKKLYYFGEHLGIAFQIQDDYLDLYGNVGKVGKQHGGDIYRNKKTFLYLNAIEKANSHQQKQLQELYAQEEQKKSKVASVAKIFETLNIAQETKKVKQVYQNKALEALESVSTNKNKNKLRYLVDYLTNRDS